MVENIFNTFKNKRVLVTGDTGFKGSWLCYWLHLLGADITGYALPPERELGHFNLLELNRSIRHVDGDIRDGKQLQSVFVDTQPEFVFHLAAQPLVRLSYQDPKTTFDTNVSGSVNVMEAVRLASSVRSFINVTSDKCYKNKEWIWGYRENDELGGHDPYSASKAAAEIVFSSYNDSFFQHNNTLGAASVRAGNVIGGGDWSTDRIVPDSVKSLHQGNSIQLRNPNAVRPWQHVLDPLAGYLKLAARLFDSPKTYSGTWNFGPDSGAIKSVQELVESMIRLWGDSSTEILVKGEPLHETGLLRLNCDKANNLLEWQPVWDFEQAISKTVDWYVDFYKGNSIVEVTKRQIEEFMEGLI